MGQVPASAIPTDEALMAQVRDGDLRKLALLFERHHRSLYNFFRHMNGNADLSQDLTQEVFFRILRYRHSFDQTRSYSAWMYQIARNTNTEAAHKRRGELRLLSNSEDDEPLEPASGTPGIEETLGRRQEIRLLRQAMEQLPSEKRELLILSRFQNLKYQSIAEILGCEVGAVKVRVYRAVQALGRIYLELSGEKAS
ncbi:MAG TPA: sigma-70 family RNA polymerase sigma factor [Bryobacteraceae bacterium]|nr:sigma-70 family RNA polymerase sigma factor [Bryobacteraceae bacterium]